MGNSSAISRRMVASFLALAAATALAQQPTPQRLIRGQVVGVRDGDTLSVLVDKERITIRLEGIDAPSAGQPFYAQAKNALTEHAFGQTANVYVTGQDRFGRIVGIVTVGGHIVNRELVAKGFARHDASSNSDRGLAVAQLVAQRAKAGLWADPTPIRTIP